MLKVFGATIVCVRACVCGGAGALGCVWACARVFAEGVGEGYLILEVWSRWRRATSLGVAIGDAGEEARTKILNDPIQAPPRSSPPSIPHLEF